MKYLKLFENFQDIDSLCEEYEIENYTINDAGIVDVDGDVWLRDIGFAELPIKFGVVSGCFSCAENGLETLEGSPKEVGSFFECDNNFLKSLKGCPNVVGDYFNCPWNKLTSLEGCPKEVGGGFYCYQNQLTSLEGCPKEVVGIFNCSNNKLTSLEWCPKKIGVGFYCRNNQLEIIDYLPEWIEGNIYFEYNKIRDIKVEDKNYRFFGKCDLKENPIYSLFQYWEGDLKSFILDLDIEDFIRDDGKSVDITRFEYALNGKEYKEEDIKLNYKLIWKE